MRRDSSRFSDGNSSMSIIRSVPSWIYKVSFFHAAGLLSCTSVDGRDSQFAEDSLFPSMKALKRPF